MADYRALEGVSRAVVHLLRLSYRPDDFGVTLSFDAYGPGNFGDPMQAGVSVFGYRVTVNGNHRMPPGRILPGGGREQSRIRVDIHLLLTVWAQESNMQLRVAGWLMRLLENYSILPFALLEAASPGVFSPDETVEMLVDDLATEDLLHLWEAMSDTGYQLSIPYLARNVSIETRRLVGEGPPMQERLFVTEEVNRT
jgi:hypothetical protein